MTPRDPMEQVDNLLTGLRLDIADLRDCLAEYPTSTYVLMNTTRIAEAHEALGAILKQANSFMEPAA